VAAHQPPGDRAEIRLEHVHLEDCRMAAMLLLELSGERVGRADEVGDLRDEGLAMRRVERGREVCLSMFACRSP
jgi:hypothetical protein